jgi:hypothetical protein
MRLRVPALASVLFCLTPLLAAQQPPPAPVASPTPAAPAPPSMIDLRFIRMKISAGDLPSAESILGYRREGERSPFWGSPGWRGARRSSPTGRPRRGTRERPARPRGRSSADLRSGRTTPRPRTRSAPRSRSTRRRSSRPERRRRRWSCSTRRRGRSRAGRPPTSCARGSGSGATRSSSSDRRLLDSASTITWGRSLPVSSRSAENRSCCSSGGTRAVTARHRRPPGAAPSRNTGRAESCSSRRRGSTKRIVRPKRRTSRRSGRKPMGLPRRSPSQSATKACCGTVFPPRPLSYSWIARE